MKSKIKVALVYPGSGFHMPPLGLGYIAAYVRKYLHERVEDIRIFDENAGDNISELIKSFNPDIVGLTATTPIVSRAIHVVKIIKAINPTILTVLGGPHISAIPEMVEDKNIDLGVLGEGEETFSEILEYFNDINISKKWDDLKKIKGIVYKDKNGEIIKTAPRQLINDINKIPPPARDLMRMKEYYCRPKEVLREIIAKGTHMLATRGCPYNCHFCSNDLLWQRKVRFFEPERVVSEIENLIETYNLDVIFFQDDMFSSNKKWLEKVCNKIIEKGLEKKISWECQERVNTITEEKLQLMKKAGVIRIGFGFESGSNRVLKILNKKTTVEQALEAVNLCKKSDLMVLGNFMIGIPGETKDDIEKTMLFIRESNIDQISLFAFTPLPGTEFFKILQRKMGPNINWDHFGMGVLGENIIVNDQIDPEEFKKIFFDMKNEVDAINSKRKVYLYGKKSIRDSFFLFKRKIIIFLWKSRPEWVLQLIKKSPYLEKIKSELMLKIKRSI